MPSWNQFVCGFLRAMGVAGLLVSVIGCGGAPAGPKLYAVKGKVTVEGQPLPNATVTFQPESGPVATGVTNASGEFTLKTGTSEGAVAGTHRVAIVATSGERVMDNPNPTPDDLAALSSSNKPLPEPKSLIPERYSKFETSQLTATVSENPSQNEIALDLKKQ